ncbi:MAG: pyridoxal phosphate-dependent aminotransferase [Geminicoccaceae bacterium]
MSANSTIKVSRRSAIDPFIVMEVMAAANARARRGGDVLHLEVGEPAAGAPPAALEAVRTAMAGGPCGYTEAFGLPMLRHALAEQYRRQYQVSAAPARIALTVGASGAFILAFLAAFDAGDRVIVTEPGYPAYRNILSALGIEVVSVPTDLATGFQPTPELLDRVQGPIAGLVLASPSNPTGSVLSRTGLARVSAWCAQRGVRIISDEIYHGITYDEPADTILAFAPDAIVVNSFSKFYGMTGWRLGWLVLPQELVAPVTRLAQNLFISAPAIAQHAALGAMSDLPELQRRLEHYRRNRALLLDRLPRMGLSRMAPPDGAFYLYVDIGHLGLGSVELCRKLLDDTGVALTPGVDFDPGRGDRYVRLSFAGAENDVAEAARRMEGWFGTPAPRLEQEPRFAGARV